MDYLITNFEHQNSKKIGNLYCSGDCLKFTNTGLKIRKSSNWRWFHKYAEHLDAVDLLKPIHSDDFYFCLDYNTTTNQIIYQTDIIGYESPFYYIQNGIIALSDNLIELALCLKKYTNTEIHINQERIKIFLLYTEPFFNETIIEGVYHGEPAIIGTINVDTAVKKTEVYDDFKMTGEINSSKVAADEVCKSLELYFKNNLSIEETYTIGMSGGLDSRVGAYFSKKNNYNIQPIFIGRKNNFLGLRTNDCKRAEEVNSFFGFPPIKYYDPRKLQFEEKILFDAKEAPSTVENISQNMGRIEGVSCIINGIIGGEALGALISEEIVDFDNTELAKFLMERISNIPKYKSRLARRISQLLPIKFINKICSFKTEWIDNLLSKEIRQELEERIKQWIENEKRKGLDNINIYHKFFYYRFGMASKFSYYASFNNTVPSINTYLNPVFIQEMLKWDTELLIDKKVQKQIILKMNGLANIRSQTVEASIAERDKDTKLKKLYRIFERIIRGGGMVYTQWYSIGFIKKEIQNRKQKYTILQDIKIEDYWYKDDYHIIFGLLKLAEVERLIS